MITVIGRGHSGTRAISKTLHESGVYMGEPHNDFGDLIPPEDLYEACRIMAKHVVYKGDLNWDFSKLHTVQIDSAFIKLIESYLVTVLQSDSIHKGWKLPETTLVFPWIIRLFPEIKYIFWIRHPWDSILKWHLTDDLRDFGIEYGDVKDEYERRAISWYYQVKIVESTPLPQNFLPVRFEDFVLNQNASLKLIEAFLGFPLQKLDVDTNAVGRWRKENVNFQFDFINDIAAKYGYDLK